MINLNKNLTFTSNIRFVSNDEFKDITKHQERETYNDAYIGIPWNRVIKAKEGLTEHIQGCSAGGFTDSGSDDVVFYHLVSTPSSDSDFDNKFKPDIEGKIKSFKKIGGLLIGGQVAQSDSFATCFSETLKNRLKTFYENVKASYSMFWGQKTLGAKTDLYYSGYYDTWFVNYKDDNNPFESNMIKSPEDVKKAYFDTAVDNNDHVFIGRYSDREIDKLDLCHEFKKIDGGYELDYSYRDPYEQSPNYHKSSVDKKVNLYLGDLGRNRNVLWVDSDKPEAVNAVMERIDKIRQSNMFKDITKVQCPGGYTDDIPVTN